jgi:hypothetical protein
MAARVARAAPSNRDMGVSGSFRIGQQILNALAERAAAAAERSRFATLPSRYLDDVGMTEAERAAALGYAEPTVDGWRVVASHL